MLKQVFLGASLLATVLAYGASASTDLSVQIVPAASPTPPPPPPSTGLMPPAAAQAAGFTTLALNLDFTGATTSSFNGRTFSATDLSDSNSWLSCQYAAGGGNAPSNPVFWMVPAWGTATPCSRASIITDGSTQVLDMQFQPADAAAGSDADEIDTWTVNEPANTGYTFPQGGQYVEFTFRVTPNTYSICSGCGGGVADIWTWQTGSGITEWDFLELGANGFGYSACHDWNGGTSNCATPAAWGYSGYTTYQTYGLRLTTDGTHMDQCSYLGAYPNTVFQGCGGEFTPPSGISVTEQRAMLRLTVGPYNTGDAPTSNMDLLIQSVRVWSCSSWVTGPCTGTVLNGSP